jgi:hypothetical protein
MKRGAKQKIVCRSIVDLDRGFVRWPVVREHLDRLFVLKYCRFFVV